MSVLRGHCDVFGAEACGVIPCRNMAVTRAALDRNRTGLVDAFRDAASKVSVRRVIQNSAAMHSRDHAQAPVPAIGVVEINRTASESLFVSG